MNSKLLFLILALITFFSCEGGKGSSEDKIKSSDQDVSFSEDGVERGKVMVKFSRELPETFIVQTRSGKVALTTGCDRTDLLLNGLGIKKIERVFPEAGKFETRSRDRGMHLWYLIEFEDSVPVTRTAKGLSELEQISITEPVRIIKPAGRGNVIRKADIYSFSPSQNSGLPFNDPHLGSQWSYDNTGSVPSSNPGADISLFQAWEKTTGHPDVIVAVIDGGVDYSHDDLAGNMWVNIQELNGTEGIDDDGNGYRDDIHGYNFLDNTGKLEAHSHGTHVAGIVAALNNNGIGVSGIAGGNGIMPGTKIMSCQIFRHNPSNMSKDLAASDADAARAIKYAADNGAVICQNSWGYDGYSVTSTPAIIREALDYFIDYAGIDENGNQQGPMRGGIAIFAAGNVRSQVPEYPAGDSDVLAVAAMAQNYTKASYSNYGDWIDITAPGGDIKPYDDLYGTTGILSTLSGYDGREVVYNQYYYMDGTSMACPHVSGIAALVISYYGVENKGLTAEAVKNIILNSTYSIDIYNPSYRGMLGSGCIDASNALGLRGGKPPVLKEIFKNLIIEKIGETSMINLSDHFYDTDNDIIDYQLKTSVEGIVRMEISEGDRLNVTSLKYGSTNIEITARDKSGLTAKGNFQLVSRDGSKNIEVFPNPVTDARLRIRPAKDFSGNSKISIYNSTGSKVMNTMEKGDTFDPAVLDISTLPVGYYSLIWEANGKKAKGSFIKY